MGELKSGRSTSALVTYYMGALSVSESGHVVYSRFKKEVSSTIRTKEDQEEKEKKKKKGRYRPHSWLPLFRKLEKETDGLASYYNLKSDTGGDFLKKVGENLLRVANNEFQKDKRILQDFYGAQLNLSGLPIENFLSFMIDLNNLMSFNDNELLQSFLKDRSKIAKAAKNRIDAARKDQTQAPAIPADTIIPHLPHYIDSLIAEAIEKAQEKVKGTTQVPTINETDLAKDFEGVIAAAMLAATEGKDKNYSTNALSPKVKELIKNKSAFPGFVKLVEHLYPEELLTTYVIKINEELKNNLGKGKNNAQIRQSARKAITIEYEDKYRLLDKDGNFSVYFQNLFSGKAQEYMGLNLSKPLAMAQDAVLTTQKASIDSIGVATTAEGIISQAVLDGVEKIIVGYYDDKEDFRNNLNNFLKTAPKLNDGVFFVFRNTKQTGYGSFWHRHGGFSGGDYQPLQRIEGEFEDQEAWREIRNLLFQTADQALFQNRWSLQTPAKMMISSIVAQVLFDDWEYIGDAEMGTMHVLHLNDIYVPLSYLLYQVGERSI